MIRKIVSGGQTGVEKAALDVAIKLGIDYGGWVPKGGNHQKETADQKYMLKESKAIGFQESIRQNVSETDGTLLITRGEKTPETHYAVKTALKYQKQLLHVDLSQNSAFEGASLINSWFALHAIKVAYVTGTAASQDAKIYGQTLKILETAFYLAFVKSGLPGEKVPAEQLLPTDSDGPIPSKVTEAVELLKSALPLKDRTLMANMQLEELDQLNSGLGEYIKQNFGLYGGNEQLMQSCAETGGLVNPILDEACAVILRALWEDLRATHKLRIIK